MPAQTVSVVTQAQTLLCRDYSRALQVWQLTPVLVVHFSRDGETAVTT